MSQQLCIEPSWGAGRTQSANASHPFLRSLGALTGERTTERLTSYLIQAALKELMRVARLPDDWDRGGSLAPRPAAVANAAARLPEICAVAVKVGPWIQPHISASETGDITFEWWNGPRKLTLYFDDQGVDLIRVWGIDIDDEMQHLRMKSTADLATSWAWLYAD